MGYRPARQARRVLPFVVLAALACRLLIPAGYMPAPIGEGGPIQLCGFGDPVGIPPGGSGTAIQHSHERQDGHGDNGELGYSDRPGGHDDHHDRHGSHDPDGNHELAWEHCPFGVLLSADVVATEPAVAIHENGADATPTVYSRVSRSGARTPFHARAPPRTSLI